MSSNRYIVRTTGQTGPTAASSSLVADTAGNYDASTVEGVLAEQVAKFAPGGSQGPSPLFNVSITAQGSTPRIVDYWDSTCWGSKVDGTIWKSVDDGVTWTQVATGPVSAYFIHLYKCSDGEVLIQYSATIRKSSGWSTNPNTATWTTKVTANSPAYFLQWGFDGNGTKFIATEYAADGDWASSNNAWISTDSGNTWTVVWDQAARFPGDGALSHCHAVCYDPWDDRFWLSEGHSVSAGIYYSDDDGGTWTAVAGGTLDGSPTVLVATNDGIVCGTDSAPGGIYGIARRAVATDMKAELIWQWFPGRAGIVGFAQRGFRDPRSGIVYIGWNSSFSDVKVIMAAGTASTAGLVYEATTAQADRFWNQVITDTGKMIGHYTLGATESVFKAFVSKGGFNNRTLNTGNILGGVTNEVTSVAVGRGASVPTSAVESVVIGNGAAVSSTGQSVVIGDGAAAVAVSVAIGDAASVTGAGGTGVGKSVSVTGQLATAIGHSAQATTTKNVAIGWDARATTDVNNVALGEGTRSTANGSTALGAESVAGHALSVALGAVSTTTATSQIATGARHIEMLELASDAAAGATNSARIYARDNGSGKTQIVVRFATGAIQVLATEP